MKRKEEKKISILKEWQKLCERHQTYTASKKKKKKKEKCKRITVKKLGKKNKKKTAKKKKKKHAICQRITVMKELSTEVEEWIE